MPTDEFAFAFSFVVFDGAFVVIAVGVEQPARAVGFPFLKLPFKVLFVWEIDAAFPFNRTPVPGSLVHVANRFFPFGFLLDAVGELREINGEWGCY